MSEEGHSIIIAELIRLHDILSFRPTSPNIIKVWSQQSLIGM
jgi:hypothetical protein